MKNISKLIYLLKKPQFKELYTLDQLKKESSKIQNEKSVNVHMLWVYGELSNLEKISICSFVRHGYVVNLWTYGDIKYTPNGINVKDARNILPEERIFIFNDSYAAFSDIFRFSVLTKIGGLWADTDVVCFVDSKELLDLGDNGFVVTERTQNKHRNKINSNLIYNPQPENGNLIDIAWKFADNYKVKNLKWGDCGPKLLTILAKNYPRICPSIMVPEFANPINFWNCPDQLISPNNSLSHFQFLHLYNEMWRRKGTDKNKKFSSDSIIGKLSDMYL